MKSKTYSMHAEATDIDGFKHEVTVVGVFSQEKENVEFTKKMGISKGKRNNVIPAKLSYDKMMTVRKFKTAYSICNVEDTFDEKYGIKIALKRIKERPIYELSSFNFSAFNDGMCETIVLHELMYICKNIDKYIK